MPGDAPEETPDRALRLVQSAGALVEDLGAVEQVTADEVVWVEGSDANPVLRVAPARRRRDPQGRACGTSAPPCSRAPRCPPACPSRLGVPTAQITELDVGSPFDYEAHALLYCAAHLPDPRSPPTSTRCTDELGDLIDAAGGRTLALFTSFRVLDEAAAALQLPLDVPILTQRDMPKGRLLEAFTADEATCLFATMGFWQGVDVPGRLAQPGRHRPDPVPPTRRAAAPGPPGAGRRRGLRPHRPPPRGHARSPRAPAG